MIEINLFTTKSQCSLVSSKVAPFPNILLIFFTTILHLTSIKFTVKSAVHLTSKWEMVSSTPLPLEKQDNLKFSHQTVVCRKPLQLRSVNVDSFTEIYALKYKFRNIST